MNQNPQIIASSRPLRTWLLSICALIFAMVIIGAITRLTDSGLSMVEWRPLWGFLPPLNDAEWNRVFDLYKASPEYEKKHFWMELADFKGIFFWEYLHRVLGRIIGLAYGVPLLVFWLRGMIPYGYGWKFFGMLILGGLQGLMGWYMVKSGLIDQPAVSHYRLAAHLSLAFLIFGLLLWLALSLKPLPTQKTNPPYTLALKLHLVGVLAIICITIIWGAFTAGMDAGLVYNDSFPKMGGQWIPPTLKQYVPLWVNFFENPVGIQFVHRWLGITSVIAVLSYWAHTVIRSRTSKHVHSYVHAFAVVALVQMSLGIATLLTNVDLHVAATHQAGALVLLSLLIVNLHHLKRS